MMMATGKGLSAVAKKAFDAKVCKLANITRQTESYVVINHKVHGVPVSVLTDKILEYGHKFQLTATMLYVAKRVR